MTEQDRARIAYHGAIILLIGLLCGLAAIVEPEGQPMPSWQAAHGGLLLNGIWLLAMSSVVPRLVLDRQMADALVVSLLGMAYAFLLTVVVQASTGVRGISPGGPAANRVAFVANLAVVLCSLLAAVLTVVGARAALKEARRSAERSAGGTLVSG